MWIVKLRNALKERGDAGKTVIISSHVLGEVEKTADEVTILKKGAVAFEGDMKTVLERTSLEDLYMEIYRDEYGGEKDA